MIASGGSSIVYRATDEVLGRTVAVKQILTHDHPDPEAVVQRARTEGRLHKQAAHDEPAHLVQLIDIIDDHRGLMLVTEFVDGPSLEQVLSDDLSPMEPRRALGILAAAAKALQAIHAKGIIHRDLKPANILLPDAGGLKVNDFGIAAIIEQQDEVGHGTPRYTAPELLRGDKADGRADIYALGIIAYEMFAGRVGFDEAFKSILRDTRSTDMRWVKWHTNSRSKAPPLQTLAPDLPPAVAELVARMMEKEPEARLASAEQVLHAIRGIVAGKAGTTAAPTHTHSLLAGAPATRPRITPPAAATAPGDTTPLPKRRSRLPIILAATFAAWVAVGGAMVYQIERKRGQEARDHQAAALQLLDDAKAAQDAGDDAEALRLYQQVSSEYADVPQVETPGRLGVLLAQGSIAMKAGQYNEAAGYFQQADDVGVIRGAERAALIDRIDEARRRGAFQQALRQIDNAIETQQYDQARGLIAEWRGLATAKDESDQLQQRSVQLYGQQAEAGLRNRLAEVRQMAEGGQTDRAIQSLQSALDQVGANHIESFTVQQMRKLLSELNAQAKYETTLKQAEAAATSGELATAIDLYRQALAMKPSESVQNRLALLEADAFYQEGREALDAGDTAEAERLLTAALGRNPEHAAAREALSRIESAGQRIAFIRAGDAAMSAGDYDTAIKQYRNALQITADEAVTAKLDQARVRLAHLRGMQALETGDLEQARGLFEAALQLDPSDAAVRDALSNLDVLAAYTRKKAAGDRARERADFGEAIRQYREAQKVSRTPEIAQALDEAEHAYLIARARAYIDAKEYLSALGMLRTALQMKDTQEIRDLIDYIQNEAAGTE